MSQELKNILSRFRLSAVTEREKGTSFENLIQDFLKNDPAYGPQFEEVWTYADWANAQGLDGRDTGIDLVAKNIDSEGYTAVQCKFYEENYRIQKSDIDSFFTASGKTPFTRRLIVDSTRKPWSDNAERAMDGQYIPVQRLNLSQLESSTIDWTKYSIDREVSFTAPKSLHPHQKEALDRVAAGFERADRGKLIMACGTGKTYTSLKIAEQQAGKGKRVLYLVPSLALMSQTVREWTNDAEIPLHSYAVCSDVQVGKRKNADDIADITTHDLAFPATTNAQALAHKIAGYEDDKMTVVFSTYHSIQVISDAQNIHGMPEFDLIICDEAHRTTGVTFVDEEESNFVKVHFQDYIQGKKRLYMTATPRIFGDSAKTKANEHSAELCSMDDVDKYGEVFHSVTFSYAVENELLTDYKVIVLAVDEGTVSTSLQSRLANEDNELNLDDVTKIIGCYKALTKTDVKSDLVADQQPMQRALAFCKSIKASKAVRDEFAAVVGEYLNFMELDGNDGPKLSCELEHVDGTYNAKSRQERLDWLSADAGADTCRILTNARCLSEGVDVPALDSIIFMHPRKSQVDVVQSVGRVMRRAEGKNLGYVILPIGIPAGMTAEEALNDNKKYQVVWQILNALRAHDDRFNAEINRMEFGEQPDKIEIIASVDQLPARKQDKKDRSDIGSGGVSEERDTTPTSTPLPTGPSQLSLHFDEFQKAILARIVKKCGTRTYWVDWANDIAEIARTHITRIKSLIEVGDSSEWQEFEKFLAEIRDDLNESITHEEAVEMLAQHLITKPVFDALFEGYSFAQNNPVSKAMQSVLNVLEANNLKGETKSLDKFYASVKMRVEGIKTAEGKQKLMLELYDKFFKNAFPRLTEKLGIVYTPVEVVDFIIHSVNDVLQDEFGQTLGSKGVHIIDPFTGTGTFITRLLQSGLIKPEELEHKYKNEIHANEIVLLAYYIAAINIEQVYHDLSGGEYEPFNGICLTDTFQLYEKDDMVSHLLVDNSHRRQKQKELDIRVIIGNPPYSAGQKSANDDNRNYSYEELDASLERSFVNASSATNKQNLYDSYIRAFRWASDRLGERSGAGVMAFVSGSAWIERAFGDGMRKCLIDEYTTLYIVHLRGDIRKNMLSQGRAGEGGNIFDSGSMTGIAISILVKNPNRSPDECIRFHDIGDNLSSKEKKLILKEFQSIRGVEKDGGWIEIVPDKHNDWLGQRDESFEGFIEIGHKRNDDGVSMFSLYSLGLTTNRDKWVYGFSRTDLEARTENLIEFYNSQRDIYASKIDENPQTKNDKIDQHIELDKKKISWSRGLKKQLSALRKIDYDQNCIRLGMLSPFMKQWVYFDSTINEYVYKLPSIFPLGVDKAPIICITGTGTRSGFSALMTDCLPNLHTVENGQCFPLHYYEQSQAPDGDLFSDANCQSPLVKQEAISDEGLGHFTASYPDENISKEDIFYYTYGLLHSEDYRTRFKDNLSKELPRILCVKKSSDFWAFVEAGRKLGDLHVNYEMVEPYPVTIEGNPQSDEDYRVTKMKHPKIKRDGKSVNDESTIIYNSKIKVTDIPLEAYHYIVNGKSAIGWVMDRQCVKTDKASGIVNDANAYAIETMGNAKYPLELLQRVITVSLETMKIVRALPKLDID